MLCFSLKLNPLRTRRKGEAPNLFDNYLKFTSIDENGAFIGVPSFKFKLGYNYNFNITIDEGVFISVPSLTMSHGKPWDTSWTSVTDSAHITIPECVFQFSPIPDVRS